MSVEYPGVGDVLVLSFESSGELDHSKVVHSFEMSRQHRRATGTPANFYNVDDDAVDSVVVDVEDLDENTGPLGFTVLGPLMEPRRPAR
jgi:hypothetical protein